MQLSDNGIRLRIYIDETDRYESTTLYEAIVLKARHLGLAGATVFRGIMGYGAASRIHTVKVLRLSEDLPIVVEVVDTEENIEKIMPFLHDVVKEGLITVEPVTVIAYKHNKS